MFYREKTVDNGILEKLGKNVVVYKKKNKQKMDFSLMNYNNFDLINRPDLINSTNYNNDFNFDDLLWNMWTGVGSFPATPQQLAAYQQQQAAHYQQQQAAGANLPPPRDFSTLTPVEQDTLLQQMGLDRSQVATNVQMQPAAAQTQQQYQYAVAPSQAAAPQQQPVEQQQQYLPVPEAPPHYSNRYNHSREAQGQPSQVVYQQQQQQAHQLPQRLCLFLSSNCSVSNHSGCCFYEGS